jgi:phytoene synthase
MPASPEPGPTRALALLYCTDAQRPVMRALTGIEAEVGASLAAGLEHSVAHARLAWWGEECLRTASGKAQHPLTRELQELFNANQRGALQGLGGFVDAATWDLASATFETGKELDAYCERWSAALIEPFAAFALAAPLDVRAFGRALRALELMCALPADARAGRVRLPLAELDAARIDPAQLRLPAWPVALVQRVSLEHARARAQLAARCNALPAAAQGPLRALMVWAALARESSQRCVAALPRGVPAGDHPAALDGWRAWRAARRADRGRFKLAD